MEKMVFSAKRMNFTRCFEQGYGIALSWDSLRICASCIVTIHQVLSNSSYPSCEQSILRTFRTGLDINYNLYKDRDCNSFCDIKVTVLFLLQIYFHGKDVLRLHNYVHPSVLPPDLCGDMTISDKSWLYKSLLAREIDKQKK